MATQLRSVFPAPYSSSFSISDRPDCASVRLPLLHQRSSSRFHGADLSTGKLSSFLIPVVRSSPLSSIASDACITPKLSDNGNGGDGGGYSDGNGRGGGGGGGDDNGGAGRHQGGNGYGGESSGKTGIFAAFLKGWNDRVSADPQFPFKVLMEEVIGVGANVIGDMASRPNFGLNELDFVFSTIVVGSILNFSLMYMLAPTAAAASVATTLPSVFRSCPAGYMFQPGSYSVVERLGTFVYKGAVFATVGFAAGLLGTTISNLLISMRKKIDPSSVSLNKAPPTVLNAATWALHMGFSSNLRYQAVNGLEFSLAKMLSPAAFKASVFCIRALNNVLGGMSFVVLARLTGSQEAAAPPPKSTPTSKSKISMQAFPPDEIKEAKLPDVDAEKPTLSPHGTEVLSVKDSQNADAIGEPVVESNEHCTNEQESEKTDDNGQGEMPILSTNGIQVSPEKQTNSDAALNVAESAVKEASANT